ncbi:MAG: chemotaxis protein CheA [Pseudobdellovibrionaceae bacterium]
MDDFERELKLGFLDEAAAAVADVEQSFLVLEISPDDQATIDKIFRLAHNLKGSSKAVGFEQMGAFTHQFESLLLKLKNKELIASPAVVNLLLRCNDHLSQWVESLRADLDYQVDSQQLFDEIERAKSEPAAETAISESGSIEEEISSEDIAILKAANEFPEDLATDPIVLEDSLQEVEKQIEELTSEIQQHETLAVTDALPEPVIPEKTIPEKEVLKSTPASSSSTADESIRVSISKLEKLLNYVGEMVILQAVMREQVSDSSSSLLRRTVHQLGKVGKEIQDISMSLRMVPIKPTFQKMQRIVRDTAQALDKDIQLHLSGEDTELDKTVLEKINDPLVHLIRNSVDHGIESSEQREKSGKSKTGHVSLNAFQQSGRLIIEVKDDGGGINPAKIRQKAIEKGIIKATAQMTDKECINLIFAPSFSTKEQVTDVSGRGVGMDVVKTNIEALQGEISIDSKVGVGSTFRISLPLTLAIIDGMVVRCGDEKFVIPLTHVHESLKPGAEDLKQTTGLGEILLLRGENLPLYKLAQHFTRKVSSSAEEMIAIVVRSGREPFAILVDDIIGQYQVVIKQLGPELGHLKGVSGSTILGDGKPALIVEPNDLIKKTRSNDLRRSA